MLEASQPMNRGGTWETLRRRAFLWWKRILFPGFDVATRKRMKLCRYLLPGDLATLDAGCGNAAFSFHACKLGNSVLGISFNADEVRRCSEYRDFLGLDPVRCRFQTHNIYDLLGLGRRFDQIICFETLEHLERDQEVLGLFARVLNPGGTLHLGTPCLNRKPYYGEVISSVEDGGHVRLGYTHDGLEEMLAKEGFEVAVRDKAVGPISQKIMDLGRWLLAVPLRRLPEPIGERVSGLVVIALLPLTWLDRFMFRGQHLCIYLQARLAAAPGGGIGR